MHLATYKASICDDARLKQCKMQFMLANKLHPRDQDGRKGESESLGRKTDITRWAKIAMYLCVNVLSKACSSNVSRRPSQKQAICVCVQWCGPVLDCARKLYYCKRVSKAIMV